MYLHGSIDPSSLIPRRFSLFASDAQIEDDGINRSGPSNSRFFDARCAANER
jgi:hypothetical protein